MEMTLTRRPAPHVRHGDSITVAMADVTIALIPCVAMGCYYYGLRLLVNCAISIVTAMLIELVLSLLVRRRPTLGDLSALVTAVIIAMLLPVGILYRYIVMASAAAMIIAKAMFGGVGKNIFNPALCGVTLVTLANTAAANTFYEQGSALPLWSAVPADAVPVTGILTQLRAGEEVITSLFDAFVGRQAGVPASVCLPLLIVAGAYLMYRRIISPHITVSMLVTVAVLAMITARAGTPLASAGYELMAGSLVFCAVFCVNDPVTTPNTSPGQIMFGVFAGAITMLIRSYGSFDDGVIFAVLIMNSTSFALDKFIHKLRPHKRGGA